MSSSYRLELDRWLRGIDVKADRVIDVGGSQLPVKNRVNSWDVQEYVIADLEDPHVGSPKPDIIMDLNYEIERQHVFDVVFCLEVFDYIFNPVQAFDSLFNLCARDGLIYATFPFMYPTHQPIEDDALRYTEFGIRKLADNSHLEILEITPRLPETNAIEMMWRGERMRAAKNYNHNVTGWMVTMRPMQ